MTNDFTNLPWNRKIQNLIDPIQNGDQTAELEFKNLLRPGVTFFLLRSIPSSRVEKLTESILTLALESVRLGTGKSPEELIVKTLDAVHAVCGEKGKSPASEAQVSPEVLAEIAALPERTLEVLFRYYASGEPEERVCQNLGLSLEDFRRLKAEGKSAIERGRPNEGAAEK